MTDRVEIDRLLREFYAARVQSDLGRLCRMFSADANFRVAGASRHAGSPIAVAAVGIEQIRSWLTLMLKTFYLDDHTVLWLIIDGPKAAVQWQANIYSRITGLTVPTELVDLIEVHDSHITSYVEFLAPR